MTVQSHIYKKYISLIDLQIKGKYSASFVHTTQPDNLTWLLSLSNRECTCSERLTVESLLKEPEAWTFFAFVGTNEGQKQT